MHPWTTLLYKDFRLLRSLSLALLGVLAAIGCALLIHAFSAGARGAAEGAGIMLLILAWHVFILPVATYVSVRREWGRTSHLWLSTPRPGWMLLCSKLLVATCLTALSYAVAFAFFYVMITMAFQKTYLVNGISLGAQVLPRVPLYGAAGLAAVLSFGLAIAIWVLMTSVTSHATKNRLGRLSRMAALAVLLVPLWGLPQLGQLSLIQPVAHLWPVTLPLPVSHATARVFLGQALLNAAVLAAIFALAGRVLDRKAEA